MQAIKDKLHDKNELRKVKADAKEEEKMHKDLAKARAEVAHEVRLAKEAQGAMELHANKAVEIAEKHEAKYQTNREQTSSDDSQDPGAQSSGSGRGYSSQMEADSKKATDAGAGTGNPASNTITGIKNWFSH